jgi:PAS domain S-box-containing protein
VRSVRRRRGHAVVAPPASARAEAASASAAPDALPVALDVSMFRRMADMSAEAFYLTDYDGRFRYVNASALRLTGYSWDELSTMTVSDIAPDYPVELYRRTIDAVTPGPLPLVTARSRRKDGTFYPVEVSVARFSVAGQVFVFGVVHDITERMQIEAVQKSFALRMLQTLEAERQRVARELHDDVGQAIASVGALLEQLELTPGAVPEDGRSTLGATRSLIDQITESVARIGRDSHPAELLGRGLEHSLRAHARRFADRHQLDLRLATTPVAGLLSRDQELHLYRIVQEALANVARHARATRVTVRLARRGRELVLFVRDDGIGLAPAPPRESGLGLVTMRERAALMGARLTLRGRARRGTELEVVLPLASAL